MKERIGEFVAIEERGTTILTFAKNRTNGSFNDSLGPTEMPEK